MFMHLTTSYVVLYLPAILFMAPASSPPPKPRQQEVRYSNTCIIPRSISTSKDVHIMHTISAQERTKFRNKKKKEQNFEIPPCPPFALSLLCLLLTHSSGGEQWISDLVGEILLPASGHGTANRTQASYEVDLAPVNPPQAAAPHRFGFSTGEISNLKCRSVFGRTNLYFQR